MNKISKALFATLFTVAALPLHADEAPNFILIYIDDLGYTQTSVPMIVAGPGIAPNSQCDLPVARWDYLSTMHDLAGSKAPLPNDLDGISLRPVLKKGNSGKLAQRDTGFVFHFPAHYTTPITAYRNGDNKLMRQLNTGDIKLFNVAKEMGETNDLSATMPEKVQTMVRELDSYIKKVGAWLH